MTSLRKLGHSCVLVEVDDRRILIDPGVFSPAADAATGLTDILLTHAHPDHCDLQRLRRIAERSPGVRIASDRSTARTLIADGLEVTEVRNGDDLPGTVRVTAVSGPHAELHPELPGSTNTGWVIGDVFYHPGDALVAPPRPVQVLGLPIVAPWLNVADAVEFLREVNPPVTLPIHDGIASVRDVWLGYIETLAPAGTRFIGLDDDAVIDV